MLLAIDAGNTNVVFAVHDGREWLGRWRIATRADRTSDEYAVWLLALFQHAGVNANQVTRCVIGTVVPAALYNLRRLCRDWFDTEPLIARAHLDWGFEIRVDQPNEVGADRLLNALASHTHYRGPLVVIDFGTATTFDAIGANREYKGGVIAPGIQIAADALFEKCAKLPRIDLAIPPNVIGRDTVAHMRAGLTYGYADLVDGLVRRMKAEMDGAPTVIATGGLAPLVASIAESIDHIDPLLTLTGLRAIHEKNAKP